MKQLIIFGIIIAISSIISPIKGQTYSYYQTSQSYEKEGYTYQCDVTPYKLVTLYTCDDNNVNRIIVQAKLVEV